MIPPAFAFQCFSIITKYFNGASAELSITKKWEEEIRRIHRENSSYEIKIANLKKAIEQTYVDKANGVISNF